MATVTLQLLFNLAKIAWNVKPSFKVLFYISNDQFCNLTLLQHAWFNQTYLSANQYLLAKQLYFAFKHHVNIEYPLPLVMVKLPLFLSLIGQFSPFLASYLPELLNRSSLLASLYSSMKHANWELTQNKCFLQWMFDKKGFEFLILRGSSVFWKCCIWPAIK